MTAGGADGLPPKADAAKRIVAILADAILAALILWVVDLLTWSLIAWLSMCGFLLFRDALGGEAGASPGKKLTGLRVLRGDGRPCDAMTSAKRNLSLVSGLLVAGLIAAVLSLLPIFGDWIAVAIGVLAALLTIGLELYKVLTDRRGLRVGDLLADTYVGDIRQPEEIL